MTQISVRLEINFVVHFPYSKWAKWTFQYSVSMHPNDKFLTSVLSVHLFAKMLFLVAHFALNERQWRRRSRSDIRHVKSSIMSQRKQRRIYWNSKYSVKPKELNASAHTQYKWKKLCGSGKCEQTIKKCVGTGSRIQFDALNEKKKRKSLLFYHFEMEASSKDRKLFILYNMNDSKRNLLYLPCHNQEFVSVSTQRFWNLSCIEFFLASL